MLVTAYWLLDPRKVTTPPETVGLFANVALVRPAASVIPPAEIVLALYSTMGVGLLNKGAAKAPSCGARYADKKRPSISTLAKLFMEVSLFHLTRAL